MRLQDPATTHEVRTTRTKTAKETIAGRVTAETPRVAAARRISPAVNTPATGTPRVGGALTADTSGIADSDGLGKVEFTCQWLTRGTAIGGADAATYTLMTAATG